MAGKNEDRAEGLSLRPLELYIHIPFCLRKCAYCDFLSFPCGEEEQSAYVGQLVREIREAGAVSGEYLVETIFIGGGTPSVLKAEETERILAAVKQSFRVSGEAEITSEANPGTVDLEQLRRWREAGVNRLSFGLQSANDRELQYLGRIHTMEDFLESFWAARTAGFENINIDLMSALPGQTEESWEITLRTAAGLKPEHISAYSLIIEEGTPFYRIFGENEAAGSGAAEERSGKSGDKRGGLPPLPGEDAEREMYYACGRILREAGYRRYEISNYARPGYECRHNKGYWTGTEYLGLGLGASSYMKQNGGAGGSAGSFVRFSAQRNLERYLRFTSGDFREGRQIKEREVLTEKARMEEFMFLGLRLMKGVPEAEFFRRFGAPMESVYGDVLRRQREIGLLEAYRRQERPESFGKRGRQKETGCFEARGYIKNRAGGTIERPAEEDISWRLTPRGIDVSNQVLAEFLLD